MHAIAFSRHDLPELCKTFSLEEGAGNGFTAYATLPGDEFVLSPSLGPRAMRRSNRARSIADTSIIVQ